ADRSRQRSGQPVDAFDQFVRGTRVTADVEQDRALGCATQGIAQQDGRIAHRDNVPCSTMRCFNTSRWTFAPPSTVGSSSTTMISRGISWLASDLQTAAISEVNEGLRSVPLFR